MIRWNQVSKRFGDSDWAVDEVNLEGKPGELLVLVGPSGCGKTTLLRMLAGLEAPSQGRLEIDGRDVTQVPSSDRDVAMVFQSYALYPHMTVAENMSFGLRLRKTPRSERDRLVSEAADVLGLSPYLSRKPKELSGGQRQRVALGRAMVRRPKVFLLDEPLSNLDAALRVSMRKEIKELQRRLECTMVYVTHDQTEAMTLADTLAVMNQGKLQQVAAPMNIYSKPANTFVATFIGSPAMNLLQGTVDNGVFSCGDLRVPARVASGKVTLGLRPEDMELTDSGGEGHGLFDVDLVEALGSETLLYGKLSGTSVAVRAPANTKLARGSSAGVRVLRSHWFEADSGRRVEAEA